MRNSYKTTCPQCNGHNLYVTPHNGLSYCYNCAYTERSGEAARPPQYRYHDIPALRQFYTMLVEYYHSHVETVRPYLHSRGVLDSEIQKYKLGYCPHGSNLLYRDSSASASGVVKSDGTAFLAGRVVFPYWVNNQVTDLRGRALDNTQPRYLSPFGGAFFRGADYPFLWKESNAIVTEGELKALAIERAGFSAIGVPGILSIRPKSRFTVVCFDSDRRAKSMADVQRAIIRLGNAYAGLSIATLPLGRDDDKMGADDYIDKYGVESFRRIINAALPFELWKRLML